MQRPVAKGKIRQDEKKKKNGADLLLQVRLDLNCKEKNDADLLPRIR